MESGTKSVFCVCVTCVVSGPGCVCVVLAHCSPPAVGGTGPPGALWEIEKGAEGLLDREMETQRKHTQT